VKISMPQVQDLQFMLFAANTAVEQEVIVDAIMSALIARF